MRAPAERMARLTKTLRSLLEACDQADADGELDSRIDGELLDAARAALVGAEHLCETCRFWSKHAPNDDRYKFPNGFRECENFGGGEVTFIADRLITAPRFGCVEWEAKP